MGAETSLRLFLSFVITLELRQMDDQTVPRPETGIATDSQEGRVTPGFIAGISSSIEAPEAGPIGPLRIVTITLAGAIAERLRSRRQSNCQAPLLLVATRIGD